jgi:hypothetical protein
MWNIADTSRGYSMPAGQYTISLQGVTDYTVHSYQNGTELRYSNYTTTANSGLVTISN